MPLFLVPQCDQGVLHLMHCADDGLRISDGGFLLAHIAELHVCFQFSAFENRQLQRWSDIEEATGPICKARKFFGLSPEIGVQRKTGKQVSRGDPDTRSCGMETRLGGSNVGPAAEQICGQPDGDFGWQRRYWFFRNQFGPQRAGFAAQ